MMNNIFWDTCVFIRYLTNDVDSPHFNDIARFVGEAKSGKRKIFYSTITLAELKEEYFDSSRFGSVRDFFEDMGSACIPIEPNPNIMISVAELRSVKSTNPGNPSASGRVIATPDAIVLMSCVFARDAMGLTDIVLHSTDEGKGKGWAGKAIPIIGFENWYPEQSRTDRIRQVCALPREKPNHPEPDMFGENIIRGKFETQQTTTV
ncbi:type II toxin-antitoxin system VapC family toxin [Sphingobium rhizovicinum]|uniref:Type II toxin-antitoxin system VapC family toxin n=1 Tax=Sphingobium rhizovicinum TaxID=432308 RepID=A0ABV7NFE1_9SPHN